MPSARLELAADAIAEIQSGLALATSTTAAAIRSALGLASANLDTQLDALPTAAENADAVWDELLSGHAVVGKRWPLSDRRRSRRRSAHEYRPRQLYVRLRRLCPWPDRQRANNNGPRVSQAGNIEELIRGATYSSAAERPSTGQDADNVWPTLTGATITVSLAHPDGQNRQLFRQRRYRYRLRKKVRLELTAVQSAALQALTVGRWSLMVWATLSGGSVVPLVSGYANVIDRPGP